jgi:hypothetical protein
MEDTDPVPEPSHREISDAYIYLLGRLLILRQQRLDFEKEGFQWNRLIYREPGGVTWANPNLDVAYSEAWVPHVDDRYYTWHMLNGWGETVLNINERNFPQHPFGRYALCLKGSSPKLPEDALRIDLPAKTTRVLARIELGDDPDEALRIQRQFKLTPTGDPKIEAPPQVPLFTNSELLGAEAFDNASVVLQSEPDINPGIREVLADSTRECRSGHQAVRTANARHTSGKAWPHQPRLVAPRSLRKLRQ